MVYYWRKLYSNATALRCASGQNSQWGPYEKQNARTVSELGSQDLGRDHRWRNGCHFGDWCVVDDAHFLVVSGTDSPVRPARQTETGKFIRTNSSAASRLASFPSSC
jgi:hypothetical protein